MRPLPIVIIATSAAVLGAAFLTWGSGSEEPLVACRYRIDDLCVDVTPSGALAKIEASRTVSIELDTYDIAITQTGREPRNLMVVRDDSIGAPAVDDRKFTERRIVERRPGWTSDRQYRLYPQDAGQIGARICRPGPTGFRCAQTELVCYYDDDASQVCRQRPSVRFHLNSLIASLQR